MDNDSFAIDGKVVGNAEFVLCNYVENFDAKGKPYKSPAAIEFLWGELLPHIEKDLFRLGKVPFTIKNNREVQMFPTQADLFAYFFVRNFAVFWSDKVSGAISKAEFHRYATQKLQKFDIIAKLPHYPPIKDVYYIGNIEPESNGKLDELVSKFNCASELDRDLLRASFASLFWGEGLGAKPAFVFDGVDSDPGKNRGIGKTTLIDAHCHLSGGNYVDLSAKSDTEAIKERLLGTEARVVRFDNIKQMKLSSEALEALLTSKTISGRKMYVGDHSVPNLFLYLLSFNGATFSKDLAQRSAVIRLARPDMESDWEDELYDFIEINRREIIADIGYLLTKPVKKPGLAKTRFAKWEKAVLFAVAKDFDNTVNYMLKSQVDTDDDAKLEDEIDDLFKGKISDYRVKDSSRYLNPEKSVVLIKKSIVAEWMQDLLGKMSVRMAGKILSKNLPKNLHQESVLREGYGYWIWLPKSEGGKEEFGGHLEPNQKSGNGWHAYLINTQVRQNGYVDVVGFEFPAKKATEK